MRVSTRLNGVTRRFVCEISKKLKGSRSGLCVWISNAFKSDLCMQVSTALNGDRSDPYIEVK